MKNKKSQLLPPKTGIFDSWCRLFYHVTMLLTYDSAPIDTRQRMLALIKVADRQDAGPDLSLVDLSGPFHAAALLS